MTVPRRPLPIRWRLALWYGALLLAGFAVLGLALYLGLRLLLLDDFHERLEADIALVQRATAIVQGRPVLDDRVRETYAIDERFVRLYDQAGALVLDTSAAAGGAPPLPDLIAAALRGDARTTTLTIRGEPFALATRPLAEGGRIVGAVQVGQARGDISEALEALLLAFAVIAPLAAAGAMVGGYIIAGRALRPVAAITRLAATANVDTGDLATRLDLDLPDDELGRLARTFDAMLERIADQVERQRRFTGDAAHELRTPLAAMRTEIDLALARPRAVDEYRAALERLDGDLARVTALLAALLLLARADAGRLAPHRGPLDGARLVTETVARFAPAARAVGVELRAATAPAPLLADERLLASALDNLVENALRHTPAGGRVTVGCRLADGNAELWVADTGSGILPAHLPRLFDRFYRVDEGRARGAGGAGLGLSIARAIAEAHGGAIAVASEPGAGTRFTLTLPAGDV